MTRLRIATATVVALVLAGCSSTVDGEWKTPSAQAKPSESTSINWRECKDEAERLIDSRLSGARFDCGTVKVPADWSSKKSNSKESNNDETLAIAVMRVRHRQQRDRIGSLLVNPGGPGASGRELAAAAPLFLPREILTRFDIVGFDPRGVGESDPVHCLTDSEKDKIVALDPDPRSQEAYDESVRLNAQAVDGCEKDKGESLGVYGTEQTAQDMDAIRQAVGDKKMTYLGYSYGTLLGAVYAQLYPEKIRAMVLDGAVDATVDSIAASEGQAAGFEKAFDNFAAACQAQPSCKIGPDARASVSRILDKVRQTPVKGDNGRTATVGHVMYAIISAMYAKQSWRTLENALSDVDNGDPEGVFGLADNYTERDADGDYSNSIDANTTINCVDEDQPATAEQARSLQDQWRAKYPLFGAPLAITLLTCVNWPADEHDAFPTGAALGAPPIVVVGTTNDPATPYANTAKLAQMLGTGVVVTYEGEGHTAYPQTPCVRDAVDDYLIQLKVPDDGTVCH